MQEYSGSCLTIAFLRLGGMCPGFMGFRFTFRPEADVPRLSGPLLGAFTEASKVYGQRGCFGLRVSGPRLSEYCELVYMFGSSGLVGSLVYSLICSLIRLMPIIFLGSMDSSSFGAEGLGLGPCFDEISVWCLVDSAPRENACHTALFDGASMLVRRNSGARAEIANSVIMTVSMMTMMTMMMMMMLMAWLELVIAKMDFKRLEDNERRRSRPGLSPALSASSASRNRPERWWLPSLLQVPKAFRRTGAPECQYEKQHKHTFKQSSQAIQYCSSTSKPKSVCLGLTFHSCHSCEIMADMACGSRSFQQLFQSAMNCPEEAQVLWRCLENCVLRFGALLGALAIRVLRTASSFLRQLTEDRTES